MELTIQFLRTNEPPLGEICARFSGGLLPANRAARTPHIISLAPARCQPALLNSIVLGTQPLSDSLGCGYGQSSQSILGFLCLQTFRSWDPSLVNICMLNPDWRISAPTPPGRILVSRNQRTREGRLTFQQRSSAGWVGHHLQPLQS